MRFILGLALACLACASAAFAAEPPGTITGELSYPSDYIPPDIHVCAEDVATAENHCTGKHIAGPNDATLYELSVPAGDYRVYAKLTDPESYAGYGPDYRAYYSELVVCGLDAERCTSHTPVVVTVAAGERVEKIDPIDWYAP